MLRTSPTPPDGLSKRLVAYIFHPFEPFVISIHRADMNYVLNFHFYNANASSEPREN